MKFWLIFGFFILLFLSSVSASFVCGQINNAEGMSSSWFKVNAYYNSNPDKKTECQVSPENKRFCCDLLSINGVSWGIGKQVTSEIFDSSGYFVEPSTISTSGVGFDIFPERNLKKAIKIVNKPKRINVQADEVYFKVVSDNYFNSIQYLVKKDDLEISSGSCSGCNDFDFYLALQGYGKYEVSFFVDGLDEIEEKFVFYNLEYVNIYRTIQCDGCSNNFVPKNKKVKVVIRAEFSHFVEEEVYDYFPKSWIYYSENFKSADLNEDGKVDGVDLGMLLGNWGNCIGECIYDLNGDFVVDDFDLNILLSQWTNNKFDEEIYEEEFYSAQLPVIEQFSETHNRAGWYFSGRNFEASYRLISPGGVLSNKYLFFLGFGEDLFNEFEVFNYFGFKSKLLSIPVKADKVPYVFQRESFFRISDSNPAVVKTEEIKFLKGVALFPFVEQEQVYFSVKKIKENSKESVFVVESNIKKNNIQKIYFSFDFPNNQEEYEFFVANSLGKNKIEFFQDPNGEFFVETKEVGEYYITRK